MTKDELLALLDDLEVRAKVLAIVDHARLKADVVEAVREDTKSGTLGVIIDNRVKPLAGPGWLTERRRVAK